MRIVVITLPEFFSKEADYIIEMFDAGLQLLHLRKPASAERDMRLLIESIPERFYSRLTLHDHHHLAQEYGIGGVHLNGRNPDVPKAFRGRLSRSCHSLSELQSTDGVQYDYQFLSPVFDSVSKHNHNSAFSYDELVKASQTGVVNQNVFALSGVTLSRLPLLSSLGFGGVALLGEPWRIASQDFTHLHNYIKALLG